MYIPSVKSDGQATYKEITEHKATLWEYVGVTAEGHAMTKVDV